MKHLWEIEHPYYCSGSNYRANSSENCTIRYISFASFLVDWGDADKDYNLLFRWDWKIEEDTGEHTLQLCYMLQRKGDYRTCFVSVTPEDELAVRAFLEPNYEYLISLWEGITPNEEP